MKTAVVIPCYNEEKFIENVVSQSLEYADMVIVSDDYSTDNTVEKAKEAGAVICWNTKDRGVGNNTASGMQFSLMYNPDIIVTLDGDGQHNPEEIPKLVKPIQSDMADIVIGSRFLEYYRLPKYRKLGIDIITWLYNVGKTPLSDAQSCFRAYKSDIVKSLLPVKESGFSFSVEMLVKARAKHQRIMEVPISCIYHKDYRSNSSINPISHGVGVALGTLKWRLRLMD